MREIKFREYRGDGRWHYWGLMDEGKFVGPCSPNSKAYQFTGLKAKYKKKHLEEDVYEGDIFRSLNEDEKEVYNVVMWIDQRAAFYMVPVEHYPIIRDNDVSDEGDFNWLFNEANLYDFSIDCGLTKVGNIHENPELL